MPYRVSFSPQEAFGLVELSGVVTWEDVASALCAILGRPDWFPSFAVLWDTRGIAELDLSRADLPAARGLMEALASARASGRSAVVVRGERDVRLAALLAGLGSAAIREVRPFYRLEEAVWFLGRRAMPEGLPLVAASPPAPPPAASPTGSPAGTGGR